MTPEQLRLDQMEQAELVWEGNHITDRKDDEHNILLYQIDDLYVEAYYHRECNVLRKFNTFSRIELLGIYTYRMQNQTFDFKCLSKLFQHSHFLKKFE